MLLYNCLQMVLKRAGRIVRMNAAGLWDSKMGVCIEPWALGSPPFCGCMFSLALDPSFGSLGPGLDLKLIVLKNKEEKNK